MTVESHMLGIGDDKRVCWWRFTGGEELTRMCDSVTAVNVEMYARDKHTGAAMCEACKLAKESAP